MKMKILFLLFFIIISQSISVNAGSKESNFKKIAEKLDVPEEAKQSDYVPSSFWKALLFNNDKLYEFQKNIMKNKGAEKEALSEAASMTYAPNYDPYLCEELQGFCDTLLIDIGISEYVGQDFSLHVTVDDEVNAYTILSPGGFSMYLTTGFLTTEGCTYDIIMAVVAHELAHGLLYHHLQTFYAKAKEKRKNQLIGGIIGGLSAYNKAYSKARGIEPMTPGVDMGRVVNILKSETVRYILMFDREQEYEADIVAFRFMQWIGNEDAYREALNLIQGDFEYYDESSNHPSTSDRIGLIDFLITHPETKNKIIEKLRKKKKK